MSDEMENYEKQEEYGLLTDEERAEEAEQQRLWDENVDPETLEFKSLAHYWRVYPEEAPKLSEIDPDPTDYTVHQQEQWERDAAAARMKSAIREGAAEGVAIATGRRDDVDPSIPDDVHGPARAELMDKIQEYKTRAAMARERGEQRETYSEAAYNQRIQQLYRELEKLPPTPGMMVSAMEAFDQEDRAVELLYNPKLADHEMWNTSRMLHDAPIALAKANSRAQKYVRLPRESSPFGDVLECKPRNMVKISLPADQLARSRRDVYTSGGKMDPNAIFRKSWNWLHRCGYASQAVPAFEPKKKGVEKSEPEKSKAKPKPKEGRAFIEANPNIVGWR